MKAKDEGGHKDKFARSKSMNVKHLSTTLVRNENELTAKFKRSSGCKSMRASHKLPTNPDLLNDANHVAVDAHQGKFVEAAGKLLLYRH